MRRRIAIAFSNIDTLDSRLRDFLYAHAKPSDIERLRTNGGKITLTVDSAPQTLKPGDRRLILRSARQPGQIVDELKSYAENEAAFFEAAAKLKKAELLVACGQLGYHPSPSRKNHDLAKFIYDSFKTSRDWKAIAGRE